MRLAVLHIILACTILSGQSLQLLNEYRTNNGLTEVVALPDTHTITPDLFIYQDRIIESRTGKTLFLLDQDNRLFSSENMEMLALFSPEKHTVGIKEPRFFKLRVFSSKSSTVSSLRDKYPNGSKLPIFFLNEKKQAIIQVSPNGDRLKFYDNHGRFLREKSFSQDRPHNYQNSRIVFSGNGNQLAFYTRIYDMQTNFMAPMVYLLSSIGEEFWKTRLVLKQVDNLCIGRSGKSVAVAGTTLRPVSHQPDYHIFVFDSTGDIRNSLPYRAAQMGFVHNEKQLLIRDEQTVKIVDLETEGIQISIKICGGRQEIADLLYLENGTFAVSFGTVKFRDTRKIYDNPEIQLFTTKGDPLAHTAFANSYSYNLNLYHSISNHQIGICLQDRFVILELNQ